jgi:lipopolysaccharide export system permease protein
METPVREIESNGAVDEPVARPRPVRETPSRPPVKREVSASDVVLAPIRLLQRILFPKLLDRYVLGELLGPFLFGWTLFILLFVLTTNLFRLASYLARGAALADVGAIMGLQAVIASVYCLPMAMLLSGLMAFNRLSGDSELIATQAGGIPNIRLIRNSLLLGLLFSFVGLGLNEYVVPPSAKQLNLVKDRVEQKLKGKVVEELLGDKAFVYQDYDGKQLQRVVIAKKFEPADPPKPAMMHDVTYMSYDKGRVEMIVEAESAEWVGADPKGGDKALWRFNNANTQLMMRLTPGQRVQVHSEHMDFTLNHQPDQMAKIKQEPDEMTYRQLKDFIRTMEDQGVHGKNIRQLQVMAEQKLAVPFAALVLALIGAPLGIRRQRSTTSVGVGLSLLIIIVYYFGMGSLSVLGTNAQIEPVVAAWGCNVIGAFAGLWLAWRSSR